MELSSSSCSERESTPIAHLGDVREAADTGMVNVTMDPSAVTAFRHWGGKSVTGVGSTSSTRQLTPPTGGGGWGEGDEEAEEEVEVIAGEEVVEDGNDDDDDDDDDDEEQPTDG